MFDASVSAIGLLLLSPVLMLIAVAIKVDTLGPVFFLQERVGLGGRTFRIVKFRTMVRDAGRLAPNVSPSNDPRVTRVGGVLRHWYVDELPQLFNVLKGDMSLVGPRPETPEHVALYRPEEQRVLQVRPGMAGPSTLAFMDEGEILATAEDPHRFYVERLLHDRVRLDLAYVETRSFRYDVVLLVRQVLAILGRRAQPAAAGDSGRATGGSALD